MKRIPVADIENDLRKKIIEWDQNNDPRISTKGRDILINKSKALSYFAMMYNEFRKVMEGKVANEELIAEMIKVLKGWDFDARYDECMALLCDTTKTPLEKVNEFNVEFYYGQLFNVE